ncbi:MAG: hypothetical protein WA517_06650 [Candidatus Acidiferrum sp.]
MLATSMLLFFAAARVTARSSSDQIPALPRGVNSSSLQAGQSLSPADTSSSNRQFTPNVKANPADPTKTDIYLKDDKTKEEKLFITLPDVCRRSGPDAQYHDGSLFIIRTTGSGITRSAQGDCLGGGGDYKRELWKFGTDKKGTQIFPGYVGGYLFSAKGGLLAVETNTDVQFLAADGKVLKTLTPGDLGLQAPSLYASSGSAFWLVEEVGAELPYLIKVEAPGFSVTKFDLAALRIGPEADFDAATERIVASDFPPIYDTDTDHEFRASKATVTLFVYDLRTKHKQVIATSVAKEFGPKWIGQDIVEYDDPLGKGRLTKIIPR